MKTRFDPRNRLIIVRAKIHRPTRWSSLTLALDTGASATLINRRRLQQLGYDLSQCVDQVNVTTGSQVEAVERIKLRKISALGQTRDDFLIVAHDLPLSAGIDGLLGLDFLRGLNLNIDFRAGNITLT